MIKNINVLSPRYFILKILAFVCIAFTSLGNPSLTDAASTWEVLAKRADEVMSSIPDINSQFPNNLISAKALFQKLNNAQEASSLFILDTRPQNEWSRGHIKGAVSMRLQELAEPQNLAKLPKDKLIVCISSTGHTAVQVTSVLRWLGYNAILLEHGMAAWMPTHATKMMQWDINNGMKKRYPIEKASLSEVGPEKKPIGKQLEMSPQYINVTEIHANAARQLMRNNIFKKQYPFNHIFADDLSLRLQNPQQQVSLFLLDVRSTPSRTLNGAIKGSVQINWKEVGKPENLKILPKDKLIVVICHTGQTSGQVTPILKMLGYNAVTLRSGMTAWTETTDSQRTLNALCNSNKPCYPIVK